MKKAFGKYALFMILILLIAACNTWKDKSTNATTVATEVYTCPMHPQIQWSQPATCPLCGMALKLKTPAQQPIPSGSGSQPTVADHGHHDPMEMGGCMECMRMNGVSE